MVKIGTMAPDFTLESTQGKISLKDYSGKYVVLFFYPLDFTPVWSTEVPEFNRRLNEFEKLNSVVLGVSTDSVPTHNAWAQSLGGVNFPLIADYNKTLAAEYGVLMEEGISLRGTYIIDPEGTLQYININNTAVGRNVMEYLRVLKALQTKKACPVNWEEGKPTIG
jgi:peroxiredoxin 2/4